MTPGHLPPPLNRIDVVERAYATVEAKEGDWLAGMMEVLRPHMDQGLGIHAYFVDASQPDRFVARGFSVAGSSVPPELARAGFNAWLSGTPVQLQRRGHLYAPCGTHATVPTELFPPEEVRSSEAVHGFADMFGLNALDASGHGCAFVAPSGERLTPPSAREVAIWGRIAVHVATAARLQRRLARAGTTPEAAAEAVLTPAGRIEHATESTRGRIAIAALREGALATERARSIAGRRDDSEAMGLWQALIGGRWTLVDQFQANGRRYLLAVPNVPRPEPLGALTDQERRVVGALIAGHATKLIGYELGIAGSTVATHIARAMKKLGAKTRVELIRAALGGAPR